VAVGDRERLEALVDSLVDVAHALLEAQHLLAHDGEAEVARLDDARVDGTDRNLVDAVAFDAHEGYGSSWFGVAERTKSRRSGNSSVAHAPWRSQGACPPRPRGDARGGRDGALHAAAHGKEPGEVRIAGTRAANGSSTIERPSATA
jgi:hypothetical protein